MIYEACHSAGGAEVCHTVPLHITKRLIGTPFVKTRDFERCVVKKSIDRHVPIHLILVIGNMHAQIFDEYVNELQSKIKII